jgi:hypothetical protein
LPGQTSAWDVRTTRILGLEVDIFGAVKGTSKEKVKKQKKKNFK